MTSPFPRLHGLALAAVALTAAGAGSLAVWLCP